MTQSKRISAHYLLAALLVVLMTACGVPTTDSGSTNATGEAPTVPLTTAPTPSPAPAPTPTIPQMKLTNGSWQLVGIGPAGQPSKPISNTLSLHFMDDGELNGSGGCNYFFGSYVITGTQLTISELGSTERACFLQELMAQEGQYLAALGSVTEFAQTDTTLTLRYPTGELVFAHVPPPPARTLENTAWRFNGFLQGEAVSMIIGGGTITLELRDGEVTGNGGCNRYNGAIISRGEGQLTIGPLASTKMACDALEAETQFMGALQTVTGWEITDQRLTLQYPGGGLMFVA